MTLFAIELLAILKTKPSSCFQGPPGPPGPRGPAGPNGADVSVWSFFLCYVAKNVQLVGTFKMKTALDSVPAIT